MPTGAQTWTWSFDAHEGRAPVLALEASAHASIVAQAPPDWFDVSLAVAAHPFRGTVDTAWFDDDLMQLAAALEALAAEDESLALHVLGGNRAAELRVSAEAVEGDDHEVVVEAWLTENGDDPVPALSFVLYDTRERLRAASRSLRDFLADHRG